MPERIVIADDEESMRFVLRRALEKAGYRVEAVATGDEALAAVAREPADLVLLDIRMPGLSGLDVLSRLRAGGGEAAAPGDAGAERRAAPPEVIVLTAHATMPNAVEAMKRGAYDYLLKPVDLDELVLLVRKALEARALAAQVETLRAEVRERYEPGSALIGQSEPMQQIYKTIGRLAKSDVTVLIEGESGTGKELIARAIHAHSHRVGKPFVAVNCAAIPRDLLEAELFGFERGAFTGAIERRIGRFEQAQGGTLFLDEIGELPLPLQAKLLRVLQEREIDRVGSRGPIPIDVRIIAATNQDLRSLVEQRRFREDLYYRLDVARLTVPPLRERREDIPALASHFLARARAELGVGDKTLSKEALQLLMAHHWPGNVRELENALKRAAVLSSNPTLLPDDFPELAAARGEAPRLDDLSLEEVLEAKLRRFLEQMEGVALTGVYDQVLEVVERPLLRLVLERTGGNQVRAAEILGINRNTLRKKLAQLGLQARPARAGGRDAAPRPAAV
ncbi:MAG TPA: sigma-54 dependent transcriptional regulator, partial [Thermodesulfobacteriota bacterium]|nr:sigma-54 dependent transcriptional regulator [Thermodesulfobacteriota bacterium]